MQPWARRGVPAALATGGMLAMGTGVASTAGTSQGRVPQPTRVPHDGDDAPSFGDFHDSDMTQPLFGRQSGLLDRDIPGRHRRTGRTPQRMALAGWVIDTARAEDGDPTGADRRSSHGDEDIGTPSEGFYRSLSWTGAVGAVSGADRLPSNRALVVPSDDPATVTGFDEPDSIEELWDGLLGGGAPTDMVLPDAIDLTVGSLADPPSVVYTVPRALVDSALSTMLAPQPPPREFIPLTIPGEFQQRANEVPHVNLDRLVMHRPGLEDKTVPLFGTAAGGTTRPASKIAAALGGAMSAPPPNPLTSSAPVTTLIRA
jgi:hypothetical protein